MISNLVSCVFNFLDQAQTLLEIVSCSVQLSNFQVAIAKLIANVDKQDRLVKYDFRLNLLLDSFKLLNSVIESITIHKALSQACPRFYVIVYSELEGGRVEFPHQMSFIRLQGCIFILNIARSCLEVPIVVQMAHLVESLRAFSELVCQKLTLGFQSQNVQAVASQTAFHSLSGANGLEHFLHGLCLVVESLTGNFKVSDNPFVLVLLEVSETEEICGHRSELVFLRQS